MAKFRDSKGRTWGIGLDRDSIGRVRDALAIDLSKPIAGERPHILAFQIAIDPMLLAEVLQVLCRLDASLLGIQESDFHDALDAKTLGEARIAFQKAWSDFFRAVGQKHNAELLKQFFGRIHQAGLDAAAFAENAPSPAKTMR